MGETLSVKRMGMEDNVEGSASCQDLIDKAREKAVVTRAVFGKQEDNALLCSIKGDCLHCVTFSEAIPFEFG